MFQEHTSKRDIFVKLPYVTPMSSHPLRPLQCLCWFLTDFWYRLLFLPQVVYDRRKIFWRYAKGWLIVDMLAAFPSTFVPGLRQQDATGNHEIAYFLSLPKMFQLYGLMNMVQENQRLHEGTFLAISTLLSVIAVSWVILRDAYRLPAIRPRSWKSVTIITVLGPRRQGNETAFLKPALGGGGGGQSWGAHFSVVRIAKKMRQE